MPDLRSRLAALTPEQRMRLRQKLKQDAGETVPSTDHAAFPTANRSAPLALSFPQRRLWFLERLEGASAAYNMPAAFRLHGVLEIEPLQSAFSEIVRRHEILRTRLVATDGEPWQLIDAPFSLRIDIQQIEREALNGYLCQEAARPFDLASEHPLRVRLLRLASDEHVVFINIHHVASDGWSSGILMRELTALYNAYVDGQSSPLPELSIQYVDFAAWQHSATASQAASSLDFWRQALADAPTGINLPTDYPRRTDSATTGDTVLFALDAATRRHSEDLAQASGCSVYQVLLTAFFCLLQRWSGETDIIVGSPIANRTRPELESLIGFFANTLPIRSHLRDDPDFNSLLRQVRDTTLAAYAHAELPFEQLVEKINPERRLNQSPFFQVMFAMQSGDASVAKGLRGLEVESLPVGTGASRLDLTLSIQESANGFTACLEYACALFKQETAQRFGEHFRNLLAAALRDPDLPLSQLELLSTAERHRLLVEWNRTDTARDRQLCLHHRVEMQAELTPEAIALTWGNQDLSYRWLIDESARIACLLHDKGIAADRLVGVCLDRSPTMIAALLGVLRAGGAYVALDPAYPAARLHYIIKDSAAPLILTTQRYRQEIFASTPKCTVIALDAVELPPASRSLPVTPVGPGHLAYVLYTSGSTGQPKGVAIEHRSPCALIDWARSVWSVDELAGVLAGTSICFDLSIFEIFLPLSVGGRIILAENVLELPHLPAREKITLVNTVPSAIDALLRQDALPASVSVVNLAGEPLTTELADRVYAVPTVRKVYDLYGPSEDTTYSTCKLRQPGEAPSIGRPIANTRLFILDRNLRVLPVGIPGEIYLAGEGLARGYLGRPDLTAERFIDCPYLPGERMYRTGDLARFRADGNVDYLGRLDHQVKLRGFRIELGEIESVLMTFPGVTHCVVIVAEASAGNPRLVGYVAHEGGKTVVTELRHHLQGRLPDYMVPTALVMLPALPLTPNGKIDRRALPAPDTPPVGQFTPPATQQEIELADIWRVLLGVETIRHDDDFFALGGHSLLAVRLQSRLRDHFHCEPSLRELFEHSRLNQQAALLARLAMEPDDLSIPTIARTDRLPLSFAQERLWFLDRLEPDSATYNMPGALRLFGRLDVAALALALDRLVERHETLRQAFPDLNGMAMAVPARHRPQLAIIDLRQAPAESVEEQLRDEARRPFNLSSGPLLRARLFCLSDEESVLAVTLHHIIADGWSVGLLLHELCILYGEASTGAAANLPPLPFQYADFAAWQRRRFGEGRMTEQMDYWRQTLAGAPSRLTLPIDHPRPAAQGYRGASLSVILDPSLLDSLRVFNHRRGVTNFMTLLAVYAALLGRRARQDDVVIGFPAAGRTISTLESLSGLFVNTLPIRLQPVADARFDDLVQQTKIRTLEALGHQELPFEKLVDALGVERSLAWSPLFQVLFVVQNAPVFASQLSGLRIEPQPTAGSDTSKFDLSLYIGETGGGLTATFEYDADLFDRSTIDRLAVDFVTVLETGVRVPETRLTDLPGPESAFASAPASSSSETARADALPTPAPTAQTVLQRSAENVLRAVWRELLNRPDVDVCDNYFELGGDSILTIVMIAKLRERGWQLKPKDVFRHQTIRELACVLQQTDPVTSARRDDGSENAVLPLAPLQQMFFDLNAPNPNHFNQSLLIDVARDIVPEHLAVALNALLRTHPALRSRFIRHHDEWWQEIRAPYPELQVNHHSVDHAAALERVCEAAQCSLDLERGPVFRADLFALGEECRLLLVAHHLVVDAVSWRIVLADLEMALGQLAHGHPVQLAPEYCALETSRKALATSATDAQRAAWELLKQDNAPLLPIRDRSGPPCPRQLVCRLTHTATTDLLGDVHKAYNTRVPDLLLTALGQELCRLGARAAVLVDVEAHGRDALGPDCDLSRSVGWFTMLYPVRLSCPAGQTAMSSLIQVKESLRQISGDRFGYERGAAPLSEVCFNYLGQSNTSLPGPLLRAIASESSGEQSAADMPRRYALDCNASVVDGELVFSYGFDTRQLDETVVEDLSRRVLDNLGTLIADCLQQSGRGYTPSDFTEVDLAQAELEQVLEGLDLSGLEAP